MLGLKWLDHGFVSPIAGYDYSPYLPTKTGFGERHAYVPGKWLPEVNQPLSLCSNGYHFCPFDSGMIALFVSAVLYLVQSSDTILVMDKAEAVATSIRLLRPIPVPSDTYEFLEDLSQYCLGSDVNVHYDYKTHVHSGASTYVGWLPLLLFCRKFISRSYDPTKARDRVSELFVKHFVIPHIKEYLTGWKD